MWCNGQGTDGAIPARYTKYLHPDGEDASAFKELEDAGIWRRADDGYVLPGWSLELRQSTAEEVERYREGARRRQKAYRDRQRDAGSTGASVTRDATREEGANVGQGRLRSLEGASAYATSDGTRHVTHNAPSPYCSKHPRGTNQPCGACARARIAFEARPRPVSARAWDCAVDGHKLVADGTCAVCTYRPGSASVA